ncbi:MAG TPA: L,D-transpeptidase family protein [Acidimicrobiales bacterium]|nr:L,D-transpeptidase family protein [Acidimicrobiales bacterium]
MTCTLALTLTACSSKGDKVATIKKPPSTTEPSTTTTTAEVTSTTVTSTTKPKVAPKAPAGLGPGARGGSVLALERRLDELRYDVGKVDGVFDSTTGHAVMAFQKVHGMSRTGRATNDVVTRLATATTPGALVAGGGATRIEVDIKRQVLFLYRGNALHRIVSVSTGSGKRYCVEGQCDNAVTPGGSFRITRRITGWRTSRLGRLWNPLYFNGGIAIHGSPSVPGYPASHGCVRIPMSTAGWLPGVVPNGTPVYVVGGPKAPVPFNEPAPTDLRPDPVPPPPTTTTTAAKPTSTTTSSTTTSTTSSTLFRTPTTPPH